MRLKFALSHPPAPGWQQCVWLISRIGVSEWKKTQHIAKKGVLSGQDLLLGGGRLGGQAPISLATGTWRNGG